jgi:cytochrome c peroxidase
MAGGRGEPIYSASAMWFVLLLLIVDSVSLAAVAPAPRITSAPKGPYHVVAQRIVDAQGRPYLVRGTEMPRVTLKAEDFSGDGKEFGPFSPSSFATIRQRLNMNAVRLPVSAALYEESADYRARVEQVLRRANRFELLVILASDTENDPRFWAQCSAQFKSNPDLFFAPAGYARRALVDAIRSSGANQPVLVGGPVRDANVIFEVTPRYAATRTGEDRWRQFGALAEHSPVLVNDLDPQLDRYSEECAAFPGDPAEATRLVQDNLTYFDAHEISWTLSSFRPSRMITDYRFYDWSKLDDGWTCGQPPGRSGIAMILLSHLWSGEPHGLFSVNPTTGGILLARGALSTAYGPILADREMHAAGRPLPFRLGNITVRVTDSRRVTRRAGLLFTGAGWSHLTFAIPADSALGPAEVALVRTDGSSATAKVIIANVAPGFWTATADGRGPVIGRVSQQFADGDMKTFPAWECENGVYGCRTVPIPLSDGVTTAVRLDASGIRYANPKTAVRVTVGDVPVQVLSFGAGDDVGRDQVTIKLPAQLRDAGETDMMMTVDGLLSNVVRIDISGAAVLPKGFPKPRVPANNPMTAAKALLGRYLFYDKRMSVNGTTSCATCHRQEMAFTDGRAQALGATGQPHPRSSMSLVNVAYNNAFNWSDPGVHSLEEQALKPMFATNPVELGVVKADLLRLIQSDAVYRELFPRAFPGEANAFTIGNVAKAIASFERTIVAAGSAYDRFHFLGDTNAISESAKRGEFLFFLDYGGPSCFRCHGGFNFSDAAGDSPVEFHNTGLYNLGGPLSYPAPNLGIYEHTKRITDVGKFKAPTLRNIALTAPYMHDGSIRTLEEVVDHYAAGGRTIGGGPFAGVGRDNPAKDKLIHGFFMTPRNRADLVAFLVSLTDKGVTRDEKFGDPWLHERR